MSLKFFKRPAPEAATLAWQKRLRYGVQAILARLGIPGVVGLGLAAFCAMIWGSAIVKLWDGCAEIEAELQALPPAADQQRAEAQRAELAAFQAALPDKSQIAILIGQVHGHAEAGGIRLTNVEFHSAEPTASAAPALPAFVVTVDTTAPHEATVKFINNVLAQMPNTALEALTFKRGKLADTALETQLRFRLYVRAP